MAIFLCVVPLASVVSQVTVSDYWLMWSVCVCQIEDLEQLLREKTESYDDLESVKLRLDSEVESNRTMIVELREVIRHLETDLEARCKTARQQQQVVLQWLVCNI